MITVDTNELKQTSHPPPPPEKKGKTLQCFSIAFSMNMWFVSVKLTTHYNSACKYELMIPSKCY